MSYWLIPVVWVLLDLHAIVHAYAPVNVGADFCLYRTSGYYGLNCSPYYVVCKQSLPKLRQCPQHLYFDDDRLMCVPKAQVRACLLGTPLHGNALPAHVIPDAFTCEGKRNGIYQQRCASLFVMCNNGAAVFLLCPRGLIYDGETAQCTKTVHKCARTPLAALSLKAKSLTAFACKKMADRRYQGIGQGFIIQCVDGEALLLRCPLRMAFSPETRECVVEKLRDKRYIDYYGDYISEGILTDVIVGYDAYGGFYDAMAGVVAEVESPLDYYPTCAGLAYGIHAYGCSASYLVAMPNYCSLLECPTGHIYDTTIQQCVPVAEVPACSVKRIIAATAAPPVNTNAAVVIATEPSYRPIKVSIPVTASPTMAPVVAVTPLLQPVLKTPALTLPPESLVEVPAPVVSPPQPVLPGPVIPPPQPVVEVPTPVIPPPQPVVEVPAPVTSPPQPVLPGPVIPSPQPVLKTPAALTLPPESLVEVPAPVISPPQPVLPGPVIPPPQPVVEVPTPVIPPPQPVVEVPTPVIPPPQPVVEVPTPVTSPPQPVLPGPVIPPPQPVVEVPPAVIPPPQPVVEVPAPVTPPPESLVEVPASVTPPCTVTAVKTPVYVTKPLTVAPSSVPVTTEMAHLPATMASVIMPAVTTPLPAVAPVPTATSVKSIKFDCSQKPDGAYDLGCSCDYVMCFHKTAIKLSCPSKLMFDSVTGLCLEKQFIKACGGTPKTTPPPLKEATVVVKNSCCGQK